MADQQEAILQERLREIRDKLWGVTKELSPEELSQLVSEMQNILPFLGEALKQDAHYVDTLEAVNLLGTASIVGGIPELNQLRNSFIEQNLDVMVQAATREGNAQTGNTESRRATIRNLSFAVYNGTAAQQSQMLAAMDAHRAEWVQNPDDTEVFQSYFGVIFEHGSPEQRKNAAELATSFYASEDHARRAAGIDFMRTYYAQFSDKSYPTADIMNEEDPVYKQVTETLKQYIPDVDDLIQKVAYSGPESKSKTGSPDNVGTRLVENMKTILYLEQQRPGICQVLRKEFGIRNFFRYPAEILIDQYDTRDTATKKGIATVALYDHNGAFYQRTSQRAMQKLFTQLHDEQKLGEKYGLMVYEIGDSHELVRAVANARRRSQDRKLSFGIVMGHGMEDSVQFGDFFMRQLGRRDTLTSQDMEHPIAPAVAGVFEQGAPILFDSCSTGKEIVQEASKLGLKVSGPLVPTSISSYSVAKQGEILDIRADWNSDKATYYNNAQI